MALRSMKRWYVVLAVVSIMAWVFTLSATECFSMGGYFDNKNGHQIIAPPDDLELGIDPKKASMSLLMLQEEKG